MGLTRGFISYAFELREPELYNLVTTVAHDDESLKLYTVPIGRCNQLTNFEESKCENKPLKLLPFVEETTKLLKK